VRPLLEILGIILIVAGVALASTAAALVVAGALAIVVANKASYTPRPRSPGDDS
jgi:hypothetical protein